MGKSPLHPETGALLYRILLAPPTPVTCSRSLLRHRYYWRGRQEIGPAFHLASNVMNVYIKIAQGTHLRRGTCPGSLCFSFLTLAGCAGFLSGHFWICLLQPGQTLYFIRNNILLPILADGRIRCGEVNTGSIQCGRKSLSNGAPANGWDCCSFENANGDRILIDGTATTNRMQLDQGEAI